MSKEKLQQTLKKAATKRKQIQEETPKKKIENSILISKIVVEKNGEYILRVNNSVNTLFLKQGQTIELWKK